MVQLFDLVRKVFDCCSALPDIRGKWRNGPVLGLSGQGYKLGLEVKLGSNYFYI